MAEEQVNTEEKHHKKKGSHDSLFLLEVLVEKLTCVKAPCTDRGLRTCITVECSAVPTIEICDDEPGSCVSKGSSPFSTSFNTGKSCLFSMNEHDISSATHKFTLKVSVHKSLPCGCMPAKIFMGSAVIDMTKEFVQARNMYLEDSNVVSHQALKDSFRLHGPDHGAYGTIDMFIRISCFGNLIVTKFQGAGGSLSLGGNSALHDRSCNPHRAFQTPQDPCACGVCRQMKAQGRIGTCPYQSTSQNRGMGGGGGVCPPDTNPYTEMPCQVPDDPCYCTGPRPPPQQPLACRNLEPYCLHLPKDCCPPGNKVIFQMPSTACTAAVIPPIHKQRQHFTFTSDGVGDITRDEPGQLMPTTAEDYPGVVYDYPQGVIKLRVGNVVEMPGRKTRMEYQFVTPSLVQEKKVPVRENRTAQCVNTIGCSPCCQSKTCL